MDQFGKQPISNEAKYQKTKIMVQEDQISKQFSRNKKQLAPNSVENMANKGGLNFPIKSNNFIEGL